MQSHRQPTFFRIHARVPGLVAVWILAHHGAGRAEDCNQNGIEDAQDLVARFGFSPAVLKPVGLSPRSVIARDLDGDQDLDLATGNGGLPSVSILRNDGQGAFGDAMDFPSGGSATRVLDTDLDGDGDADLVTNSSGLALLFNRGDATFADAINLRMPGSFQVDFDLADVDSDGDEDIVVLASSSPLLVLLNDGTGRFPEPSPLAGADVMDARALLLDDLDRDGDADLALMTDRRTAAILLNAGGGSFVQGSMVPAHGAGPILIRADLDADRDLDLVAASWGAEDVDVFTNQGAATFAEPTYFRHSQRIFGAAAADVDGDGDGDLVTSNREALRMSLIVNEGPGKLRSGLVIPIRGDPISAAAADLDADGRPDLICTVDDSSAAGVLLNRSNPPHSRDANANGRPDECDLDCNGNGSTDDLDIQRGDSADCNRNGVPDECDLQDGADADRNANGLLDACETLVPFHRGDPNGDGSIDISDGLCTLGFLFEGTGAPGCFESADANNDGRLDCSDAIVILGYLFLGTEAPAVPGPPSSPCGIDPDGPGTAGDMGCDAYAACG